MKSQWQGSQTLSQDTGTSEIYFHEGFVVFSKYRSFEADFSSIESDFTVIVHHTPSMLCALLAAMATTIARMEPLESEMAAAIPLTAANTLIEVFIAKCRSTGSRTVLLCVRVLHLRDWRCVQPYRRRGVRCSCRARHRGHHVHETYCEWPHE